jgi:predicted nucleic acid-binding protein
MKIYLDNCCFNRPFDDQSQLRIRLEAEAKLQIQDDVRASRYTLVWSYILDYENSRNPFRERREQMARWRRHARVDVTADAALIAQAEQLASQGFGQLDALHLACALRAGANCFITTDDGILKKADRVASLRLVDPITFIKLEPS